LDSFIYPGIYLWAYPGKGHPELVYITNEKEGTSSKAKPFNMEHITMVLAKLKSH
jgi:hypothetical protein